MWRARRGTTILSASLALFFVACRHDASRLRSGDASSGETASRVATVHNAGDGAAPDVVVASSGELADATKPWDPLDLAAAERLCDGGVAEACIDAANIRHTRQALCAKYRGEDLWMKRPASAVCPDDAKAAAAIDKARALFGKRCLASREEFCPVYFALTYNSWWYPEGMLAYPGPLNLRPDVELRADPAYAAYKARFHSNFPESDCTERAVHCDALAAR